MTTAHAHADHAHDDHHGHEHHVSSMFILVGVFAILLVMTAVTVLTAKFVDLGETGNFILAMAIATFKASLVCAFFMHLLHDRKFNTVVLFYCLLTLTLFILFTKIDLQSRRAIDPRRDGQINEPTMVEDHRKSHDDDHAPTAGEHAPATDSHDTGH